MVRPVVLKLCAVCGVPPKVPVIRQPFHQGDRLPFWALGPFSGNHLYDLHNDPSEDENRAGERRELESADRLRSALQHAVGLASDSEPAAGPG